MCWVKVAIRLSHLILKQYYEGGGTLPSLQTVSRVLVLTASQIPKPGFGFSPSGDSEGNRGDEKQSSKSGIEKNGREGQEKTSTEGLMCAGFCP